MMDLIRSLSMSMGDGHDFTYYANPLRTAGELDELYGTLSATPSPVRRFSHTRAAMRRHGTLPDALVPPASGHPIGDAMAEQLPLMGDEVMRSGRFEDALALYANAVNLSRPGTRGHAYGLSGRSAAYFHLGRYERCVADVRRALATEGCPADLACMLYERAGNAERLLGRGDRAVENYAQCRRHAARLSPEHRAHFESRLAKAERQCEGLGAAAAAPEPAAAAAPVARLTGGSHPKVPAMSSHLELKCSPTMGRGVYAARDLNPGDVVVIDEPYIFGSHMDIKMFCHYHECMKHSKALIPCPKCRVVYFCDEVCMQKANEDGHNLECPILPSFRCIPVIAAVALRWFIKEYTKLGPLKYCETIHLLNKTRRDPLTRGFNDDGLYKSDDFLTAYSLQSNEDELSMELLFFFNCVAAEIMQYLILSDIAIPNCYVNIIGASLVRMLVVINSCESRNAACIPLNMKISAFNNNGVYHKADLAHIVYPTVGLFNHSCDPNVVESGVLNGRIRVMRAIQPIPKGSQLFISYGVLFGISDKKNRESFCLKSLMFKCQCIPCVQDWPTYMSLPTSIYRSHFLDLKKKTEVMMECNKFTRFKQNETLINHLPSHINYLYSFINLLFVNVKRPFKLYEDCLGLINVAQILPGENE